MKDNGRDVGTQQSHPTSPGTQKAGGTSGAGLTALPEPFSSPNRRRHNGQRGLKAGGGETARWGNWFNPSLSTYMDAVKPRVLGPQSVSTVA